VLSAFSGPGCRCKKRKASSLECHDEPSSLDIPSLAGPEVGVDISRASEAEASAMVDVRNSLVDERTRWIAAFDAWVKETGLSRWIDVRLSCNSSLPGCFLKIPLEGNPAAPQLDVSGHGRPYQGLLYHGTSFSYLPSICSSGTLLRCSVPTRNKRAIWSGELRSRALMYAAPARLDGKLIQCVIGIEAQRVKSSHFKSRDQQLILRECWGQVKWL
jgi:hypothetical protein